MGENRTKKTTRIAVLNDLARVSLGATGALALTPGIRALPDTARHAVLQQVRRFDAFTPGDNPYGERDFGAFDHDGERILWKIDYYDPTGTGLSDDPSDPQKTFRVLTVMLAWEY